VSGCADAARALYLELRAQGLEVRVVDDPSGGGGPLDYGIAIGGLGSVSASYARSIRQRVLESEEELVQLATSASSTRTSSSWDWLALPPSPTLTAASSSA
jgi:hypothetical protein